MPRYFTVLDWWYNWFAPAPPAFSPEASAAIKKVLTLIRDQAQSLLQRLQMQTVNRIGNVKDETGPTPNLPNPNPAKKVVLKLNMRTQHLTRNAPNYLIRPLI